MQVQLASCLLLLAVVHGVWSKCPGICTLEYAPVCGSDGKTYSNECFFKVATCNNNADTTIVHSGECKESRAKRNVENECSKFVHSNICTLEYAPVCASNGKTYPNLCAMCAYMNQQQKEGNNIVLTVEHRGACKEPRLADFCTSRDITGICTREYDPICGSDGKTHANRCTFCYDQHLKQQNGEELTVAYEGECRNKRNAFDTTIECLPRMKKGVCTFEYFPVCGSDGKTYGNKCTFCYGKYQKEENGEILEVDHFGECATIEKRSAADIECKERYNTGACTREYFPVCGSDGKTYGNKCTFCYAKHQKQQNGEDLMVDHFGQCAVIERRSVDEIECKEHFNTGACTREYFPVCASDGKTYGNKCTFCYAKHQKQQNGEDLMVDHFGQCAVIERRSVDEIECKEHFNTGACTREYFPVCASDGKTYGNKCTFCYAKHMKQQNGEELTFDHFGSCIVIERRSVDEVECVDDYKSGICTLEYAPICGSNGATYGNTCEFCYNKFVKEEEGEELTVANIGECKPKHDAECSENSHHGVCTDDYRPVCGSDGKTYANKCMYCFAKYQKEQNGEELSFDHDGKCKAIAYSANEIECLDRYNTGVCTREYFPVCGSDGKTYGNKCMYCYAKSQNGGDLTVDHFGACATIEKRSADDIECKERYNTGACTREYFPVCGSDGKTYGNKCTFCYAKHQKQQNGEDLMVDHFGQCAVIERRSVDEIECKEHFNTGACTREYFPVCASDGKTYGNKCTFCYAKHMKQQNGEELTFAHFGSCKAIERRSVDEVECVDEYKSGICTLEYAPICGSNGATYGNTCEFCYNKFVKEEEGEELTVANIGECKPKHNCPESSKHGICTLEYAPVCGNNKQTYANECELCADMYKRQQMGENIHIHVVHTGVC